MSSIELLCSNDMLAPLDLCLFEAFMNPDENALRANPNRFTRVLALVTLPALLVAGIHEGHHWTAALIWCGASLMVGALLGLFLAVPRFRVPPANSEAASAYQLSSANPATVSTNLESVADWLTKILIGVALTDIRQMPDQFRQIILYVETSLTGKGDEPFVTAMILYFFLAGFIANYVASRLYFRNLASAEGASTIGSLSKALEVALRAPVMVNYQGVVCLRVRQDREKLNAAENPIPLRQASGSIELEAWLQPSEPHEFGVVFAPVSITGGEKRQEAEFEIRLDSDSFQPDKLSETLIASMDSQTRSVVLRAQFSNLGARLESPISLGGRFDGSSPQNPLWVMLFQQNRLVQTISLDFASRY